MKVLRHLNDSKLTDRQNLSTPQISGQLRSRRLRRRYGTEILGALLFVAAIVAFNSFVQGSSSNGAKAQGLATHATTTLEAQSGAPSTQTPPPATTPNATVNQEDTSMSQSSSNNADSQVTVNGVDVPVPVSGTSQQTVVGNGSPTSVTITSNHSETGHASNTSRISTHLNVSTTTRSNNSSTESESGTP